MRHSSDDSSSSVSSSGSSSSDSGSEDAPLEEFGWGGAASCHYWVSPEDDDLLVITLEQTVPYNWNLERTLKPVIYGAVRGEKGE